MIIEVSDGEAWNVSIQSSRNFSRARATCEDERSIFARDFAT